MVDPEERPPDPSGGRILEILDRFIDRHIQGETVDLDEFCAAKPPELREAIRRLCSDYLNSVQPLIQRVPPTAEPEIKQLGDFRIIRELGRGGMGVVYLAWQKSLQRSVALKILHAGLSLSSRHMERFRREGIAAGKLQHRFIVRILSVGEWKGLSYIAMDFIDGRSLSEELNDQLQAEGVGQQDRILLGSRETGYARQVAKIVQRTALALQYAHDNAVIHRDIKPQNILVREGDLPCVVDFGLAKEVDKQSLSREGDIAGTPYYMSPEQALAKRVKIDHRTDIFSLGSVLYEMLTLKRAFDGDAIDRVLFKISFKEPDPVRRLQPQVHRDLETICHRALEKDPERRFASMAHLAEELERFLNNEALRIRPTLPLVRWTRSILRNRVAAVAIGFLLLFLVSSPLIYRAAFVHGKEARLPRLTIMAGKPGLRVLARRIDPGTAEIGAEELIGTTPLERHVLEPGYYRFIVVDPDVGGYCELTRYLAPSGREYRPAVRIRPTRSLESSMRRFDAGEFVFGHDRSKEGMLRGRKMSIGTFLMDVREVSIGKFKKFLRETGASLPRNWPSDTQEDKEVLNEILETEKWDSRPVMAIDFREARAFAEWNGKRLPTVFEWERAARGSSGRLYPWASGRAPSEDLARLAHNRGREDPYLLRALKNTVPVVSLSDGRTPEGLYHMLGNVQEWTESPFVPKPPEGAESSMPVPSLLIVMGGSWATPLSYGSGDSHDLRCYDPGDITSSNFTFGFRCAKSVRD